MPIKLPILYCQYDYKNYGKKQPYPLTETVKRLVNYVKKEKPKTLILTGKQEPLLEPQFIRDFIHAFANEFGARTDYFPDIELQTNAKAIQGFVGGDITSYLRVISEIYWQFYPKTFTVAISVDSNEQLSLLSESDLMTVDGKK